MWQGCLVPDNGFVSSKWAAVTPLHPENLFMLGQVISSTPPATRWRQGWV